MTLQLIEVYLPKGTFPAFNTDLEDFNIISHWTSHESTDYTLIRILVETKNSEDILNYLEKASSRNEQLKALLFSLQTYIPHLKDEKEVLEKNGLDEKSKKQELIRASRHELYSVVHSSSEINKSFSWFLFLSALVATAGIIKNSPAIVIGAMVIAPLIGPFTAVSFASVLGDYKLMKQSFLTSLYGLAIPLGVAILFGYFFKLPANSQEFLSRTNIELIDIVAALASGAAGAISFLKRVSEALVGVMVSVALLPPTVVLGMMVGAAEWQEALTPLLLLLVNINSIVLSAIIVFWLSGIKPVNWREIQASHTSRKFALFFVSMIIVVLFVVIYFIKF
jgi:uncharacterized hydrophobic protein (TIGR00341 family)